MIIGRGALGVARTAGARRMGSHGAKTGTRRASFRGRSASMASSATRGTARTHSPSSLASCHTLAPCPAPAGRAVPQFGGRQEMPPPGGFPNVTIKRGVPAARGLTGGMIWGGMVAATVLGFFAVGQGNIARREAKKERRLARAALIPLLQAEEDVRYVMAKRAADEKEAELMSGVPGWKVGASVYNSGAWMPATAK